MGRALSHCACRVEFGLAWKNAPIFSLSFVATAVSNARNWSGSWLRKPAPKPSADRSYCRFRCRNAARCRARCPSEIRRGRISAAHRKAPDQIDRCFGIEMRCFRQARCLGCRRKVAFDAEAMRVGGANTIMRTEDRVKRVDQTFRVRFRMRRDGSGKRESRDEHRGRNEPFEDHGAILHVAVVIIADRQTADCPARALSISNAQSLQLRILPSGAAICYAMSATAR